MDFREHKGIFSQEGTANSRCRTAIGSAGSTAAFILGACNVSLIWQLWANVITFLVSVPGLLYTGFNLVTEDAVIDAATTHVDWIDTAETNEAISTREKNNVHSVTEASLSS